MGRASVLLLLIVAACGGAQIPQHNGYKAKAKPWKKAKTLKFDDKSEAKATGELSYAEFKRAAWFVADLQQPGQLDIKLDITPPGEEVDEDFDLGFEVLDAGNRVIARSNKEEGDDTGEMQKSKSLLDLEPGRYMIHLYLQDRRDTCDYVMRATFKPMSSVGKSDFPSQVAFTPSLPMVPLQDDTPKGYKSPTTTTTVVVKKPRTGGGQKPPPPPPPPPPTTKSARIIGMQVVGGGTQITIGLGTAGGASVGMKGKINNVASGGFTLAACNERTCTATVSATPDQIKTSGAVTLGQ
ncbi:MAG TPA: hypothetical protein VMZ53_14955 [Kofleriaceae bacterium]|nr:hypothetical protein [Kofleriaceae bacterium]